MSNNLIDFCISQFSLLNSIKNLLLRSEQLLLCLCNLKTFNSILHTIQRSLKTISKIKRFAFLILKNIIKLLTSSLQRLHTFSNFRVFSITLFLLSICINIANLSQSQSSINSRLRVQILRHRSSRSTCTNRRRT